jgi:hypothetical protein
VIPLNATPLPVELKVPAEHEDTATAQQIFKTMRTPGAT